MFPVLNSHSKKKPSADEFASWDESSDDKVQAVTFYSILSQKSIFAYLLWSDNNSINKNQLDQLIMKMVNSRTKISSCVCMFYLLLLSTPK